MVFSQFPYLTRGYQRFYRKSINHHQNAAGVWTERATLDAPRKGWMPRAAPLDARRCGFRCFERPLVGGVRLAASQSGTKIQSGKRGVGNCVGKHQVQSRSHRSPDRTGSDSRRRFGGDGHVGSGLRPCGMDPAGGVIGTGRPCGKHGRLASWIDLASPFAFHAQHCGRKSCRSA